MKCHNPDCDNELAPSNGPRPRKWCSPGCRRRARRAQDREYLRRHRATNPDATKRYAKIDYDRHQEQVIARRRVNDAIRYGHMERGECEVGIDCEGRIEAHHDDYSRPLDVRWFCVKHHAAIERGELVGEVAWEWVS